jgi:phosphoesterase RecJ-like protein
MQQSANGQVTKPVESEDGAVVAPGDSVSDALDRAVAVLAEAERPALACHIHPDGDAHGSLLALHLLGRAHGKASVASWPEPFRVAPHYRFLPGLELATPPERFPAAPEVMVTFDLGSPVRLGELAAPALAATELIVLDHHADNQRFGTVNVVDTDAAATAVVVREIARRLGWELDRDVAINLYAGLVTDTGRFRYPNTTPEVFELAEELAAFDLPIPAIVRELFEKHRFSYLMLVSEVLGRAILDPDRRFIAAWVTVEDLEAHGVDYDETEGLIDHVRQTAEADIACVLKEAPGEGLRVSLRSDGSTDVAAIAAVFGGGGHSFMAGFLTDLSIREVVARLRDLIPER